MRVVIDTNIFMAALLNASGAPAKLRRRWQLRQFEIVVSNNVLDEYFYVLNQAPAISTAEVALLMLVLASFAKYVNINAL